MHTYMYIQKNLHTYFFLSTFQKFYFKKIKTRLQLKIRSKVIISNNTCKLYTIRMRNTYIGTIVCYFKDTVINTRCAYTCTCTCTCISMHHSDLYTCTCIIIMCIDSTFIHQTML